MIFANEDSCLSTLNSIKIKKTNLNETDTSFKHFCVYVFRLIPITKTKLDKHLYILNLPKAVLTQFSKTINNKVKAKIAVSNNI